MNSSTLPQEVRLFGVRLSALTMQQAMARLLGAIRGAGHGFVCVANVHTLTIARRDAEFRRIYSDAFMVIPDGKPLIWALSSFGVKLPNRVYGPDFMLAFMEFGLSHDVRHFLCGGYDERSAGLQAELQKRHPGLQIVGRFEPSFKPLDPDEVARTAAAVNATDAEVVWVGVGAPRQEKLMALLRPLCPDKSFVGVGAAFDLIANYVPKAPPWMQQRGLEWAYRLWQEPRRLWRRYLGSNSYFLAVWFANLVTRRGLGPFETELTGPQGP